MEIECVKAVFLPIIRLRVVLYFKNKMNKTIILEILFRIFVGVLMILGVTGKFPLGFYTLLFSGFLSGLYYGYNDDVIWSTGRTNNVRYNIHLLWVHIICGLVAAMSLYLLSVKTNLLNPETVFIDLKVDDTIFFLVSLLGYIGLLPRTFWFIANAGRIKP
jgi:hypothetical protein